ncbi:IS3 family transposase [Weissella confusa]|uniref:IS3 family transposase n=1 Tax=Weissella confusa TaxID=1583 RepID=UPI003BAAA6D9
MLKVGTVHNNHYQSYDELKSAITNYVYYYNNKRLTGRKNSGSIPKSFRPVSRLNFTPIFGVQFTEPKFRGLFDR